MKYTGMSIAQLATVLAILLVAVIGFYTQGRSYKQGAEGAGGGKVVVDANGITSAEFDGEIKEFVLLGPIERINPYRDTGSGHSDLNFYLGVPVEHVNMAEARTIIIDGCQAPTTYVRKEINGKDQAVIRARLLIVKSVTGTNKIWTTVRY